MDTEPRPKYCDILIVGAGFAGSLMGYKLKRIDPSLDIIVIDKKYPGSHEASYSIPYEIITELGLEELVINEITENTYEVDTIDYQSISDLDSTSGGLATVSYTELCEALLGPVNFIKDEFLSFADYSYTSVLTKNGTLYRPNIIIDATGWESPLRQKMDLRIPKIGAKTALFKLENCNIDYSNRMILSVGDLASYGFWAEPQSDDVMLVGSGFWDNIQNNSIMDRPRAENLLFLYLKKYSHIFDNAVITEKHFAKVAVDPVKEVVFNNIISIGESAGMSNPYWTLGAGHIFDFANKISNHIINAVHSNNDKSKLEYIEKIQQIWEGQMKKYRKNWGAARVIWNHYAEGWHEIFENREELEKYTTPDQLVQRQKQGEYSTSYAIKMLGWKRILGVVKYMTIFNLRLKSKRFYNWYNFDFRDTSIFTWDELREKTSGIREQLHENKIKYETKNDTNLIDVELPIKIQN